MSFNDIFKSDFIENVTSVSLLDMAVALLLAFGMGMFIFLVYKKTYSGVMYSASFGTTLVALTMPVSLVFSMLCFHAVGLSLNIISLSGLLLGVGMMTDNTIVLVDNITGRWQRDGDLRQAVLKGTSEVMGPMLSSVLTTCAVFIPLVFLGGIAGAMFHDQAISVTIVLLTSYVVTITVIPVFYYWWYKGKDRFAPSRFLERINFERPLQRWDDKWMGWCLRHRSLSWGLLAVSLIGATACFLLMPKERLPEMTQTDTILKIEWNEHLAIENNTDRIRSIETLLSGKVSQMTALVGADKVKEELEAYLASSWPAATYSFSPSGNIFDMVFSGNEAPLTAKLRPVRAEVMEVAPVRKVVSGIRDALPGAGVSDPAVKTDVLFVADPDLLALYGVSVSDLLSILRNSLNENRLFNIVQGSRSVPVVTGSNAGSLSEILSRTFVEKRGEDERTVRIPASDLMRQTLVEDFKTVVAGAEGNYYPVDLDVPSKDVRKAMDAVKDVVRDDGAFEAGFSGSWFSNRKMVDQMILILLIAVTLLYLILASQFESLVQPLIILSEIVIDIFFSLLALWIFGVSVNLMSMIGLIVITGIVINDSILKIDTINRMRKAGESLERAVLDASSRRMKAIIMTSLTTILAVCPFLVRGSMGADLQYPMSLVIIAGMLVGTLVSLFVVPAIYYSIYNGRKDK